MTDQPKTIAVALIAVPALFALSACSNETDSGATSVGESEWQLVPGESRLTYVSVKAGEVMETNRFTELAGTVAPGGAARLEIDLASVNTGVDIRNERMRELFFEVDEYPTATVTAALEPDAFEGLAVGERTTQPLQGTLSLKGIEGDIETQVDVTRIADDRVLAVSSEPVIVYADAFGLSDGIEQLREIAGLPSITPSVPVTFSLTFERGGPGSGE